MPDGRLNAVRRPIIGIPTHSRDVTMAGLPPAYIMGQHYVKALAKAGGVAIMLPLYQDAELLADVYRLIDGLFLAGGSDLNPHLYRAEPHPKLGDLDHDRDWVEVKLVEWAMRDAMPILAVCRGVQVLNVASGGTLHQDISSEIPDAMEHNMWQLKPRDYLAHEVEVDPGSRLGSLLESPQVLVNSLHHQSIRDVAPGLRVAARASDGVIEAVESASDHFRVGVQWHPEALIANDAKMLRLFEGFVEAVEAYAEPGGPGPGLRFDTAA